MYDVILAHNENEGKARASDVLLKEIERNYGQLVESE